MSKQHVGIMDRIKRIITGPLENTIIQHNNTVVSDFSGWHNKYFWGIEQATLETNETIFASISRLSNSMASLPIKLYKNYEKQDTDTARLLTRSPNVNMTPFDLIRRIETIRNEKGNAYVVISRDRLLQPEALYLLNSDNVTPAIDGKSNELYYVVRNGNNKIVFHNAEILHFKHISAMNSEVGISPINVLKNTTEFDNALRKFNLDEMQKMDAFIINYATTVSEEQKRRVIENFKHFFSENGGVLFQEQGVEIEKLDRKYVSEDVVNAENLTRQRVANAFGIPTALLNADANSMKSVEELNRFYLTHTLLPIIKQYEDEFNKKLLNENQKNEGFYFKFNTKALLRADVATQAEAYFKAGRTGWYTVNEIRGFEDMPPIEGGDVAMVSGDLYPITLSPAERNPAKGGDNNDKKDE